MKKTIKSGSNNLFDSNRFERFNASSNTPRPEPFEWFEIGSACTFKNNSVHLASIEVKDLWEAGKPIYKLNASRSHISQENTYISSVSMLYDDRSATGANDVLLDMPSRTKLGVNGIPFNYKLSGQAGVTLSDSEFGRRVVVSGESYNVLKGAYPASANLVKSMLPKTYTDLNGSDAFRDGVPIGTLEIPAPVGRDSSAFARFRSNDLGGWNITIGGLSVEKDQQYSQAVCVYIPLESAPDDVIFKFFHVRKDERYTTNIFVSAKNKWVVVPTFFLSNPSLTEFSFIILIDGVTPGQEIYMGEFVLCRGIAPYPYEKGF